MRRVKGQIIFDGPLDLKLEVKRQIKPMLKEIADKAKQEAVTEALELMFPIACNAIYEAYGIGPKRQEQFLKYFKIHLQCLDEGVTTIDDYEKWCADSKIKTFKKLEEKDE